MKNRKDNVDIIWATHKARRSVELKTTQVVIYGKTIAAVETRHEYIH